jgi:hypothetical protein
MSLLTINHLIVFIWVHNIWSLLNYICYGKLCTCDVVWQIWTQAYKTKACCVNWQASFNVVPFGIVYLLELEFQGYCIWLCVKEVYRLCNRKLLPCILGRTRWDSPPQQKSLSKSVGVNRAIFHDLVCTTWYSFRVSLMTVVPLPSQIGSWWSLIFLFPYSGEMWHNYNGWTKTPFQFMCSYMNPFIIVHFFQIFSVFQYLHVNPKYHHRITGLLPKIWETIEQFSDVTSNFFIPGTLVHEFFQ